MIKHLLLTVTVLCMTQVAVGAVSPDSGTRVPNFKSGKVSDSKEKLPKYFAVSVIAKLKELMMNDPAIFIDLVAKARDDSYQFVYQGKRHGAGAGSTREVLTRISFFNAGEWGSSMHPLVRTVILTVVKGEGHNLELMNPFTGESVSLLDSLMVKLQDLIETQPVVFADLVAIARPESYPLSPNSPLFPNSEQILHDRGFIFGRNNKGIFVISPIVREVILLATKGDDFELMLTNPSTGKAARDEL